MGLLNLFGKSAPQILRLPSGSFTVDRDGFILARTTTAEYPDELVAEVARQVLHTFRSAAAANLPLTALTVSFKSLRITARELRGGAIIFFIPINRFANN